MQPERTYLSVTSVRPRLFLDGAAPCRSENVGTLFYCCQSVTHKHITYILLLRYVSPSILIYSLPTYEASHEFDKRGRRQPPVGPPVHPPVETTHRPPAPSRPPLHYNGRPPPPRESFRNGPPPSHHYPPGGGRHRPPPRYAPPAPLPVSAPVQLPPIVYRPGEGLIPSLDRPSHLPPRPQDPLGGGRGEREPERRGGGRYGDPSSELNYG